MQIIDVYYLDTNLLLVCRFCFARVSRITPQSHGSWRCRASSSYKITTMYVRTRGWHPSNLQGSKIAKIHIQITRQNQSQGHRPEALLHGMGMCPVKDSTIELKVRGRSLEPCARAPRQFRGSWTGNISLEVTDTERGGRPPLPPPSNPM